MNRRLIVVIESCFLPMMGLASSVIWGGGVIIDQSTDPYYSEMGYQNLHQWLWTIDDVYIKPNVFFEQVCLGQGISIGGVEMGWCAYGTLVKRMEPGDVIDASSMSNVRDPFPPMLIEYGSSIIIGFKTESWDKLLMETAYGYGWIELEAETFGLVVRNGAYGIEGQSMYAGGGAIPEPSNALLILLGIVGVALKRKRAPNVLTDRSAASAFFGGEKNFRQFWLKSFLKSEWR